MKALGYFYYINGRVPTNIELITATDQEVPDYIESKSHNQNIFPCHLYEIFRGNIALGSDCQISKDAMTEFYHNLSM